MSGTVEQLEQGETCNTRIKSRAYIGTWNSYPEDYEDKLKAYEKFVFQKEIGDAGNEHIQFAIYTKNPCRVATIREQLVGAHIEVAKSWGACKNYCQKKDTAVEGTLVSNVKARKVRDPLEGKELRPLQAEILRLLESEPDDRSITWVVDLLGNSGKTTLAKHLCLTRKDTIYITGKSSDMKFGVSKWLEKNELSVVLIDLARSQENFVSYQGIEEVKNGIFYNTKYESAMCVFDPPHVVVFANFEPDLEKLSKDRWNIINVEQWNSGTVEQRVLSDDRKSQDELDEMYAELESL